MNMKVDICHEFKFEPLFTLKSSRFKRKIFIFSTLAAERHYDLNAAGIQHSSHVSGLVTSEIL